MRILVVDDHDVVRRGLRSVLEAHPGWQICAEATNGRNAVAQAQELNPDVIVMDISMPDMNGLEAARQIKKICPKVEIVMLSVHFSDQLVREIVNAGAKSYILKSDAERDLVIAVEAVANHRSYFTTQVSEMVMDGFRRRDAAPTPQALKRERLTSREREIVQLLAEGRSSKQVATTLGISTKTAETHRANIMRKLEIHSVSDLVRYAVRNQIIEP